MRVRTGRTAVMASVGVAALIAAGCGSVNSSGDPAGSAQAMPARKGVEQARLRVEEARTLPQFPRLGPPLDVSQMKGKRVFRISYADAVPYMALVGQGVTQAAEAAGASVTQFDAKAQLSEAARGIERAASQRYNAIIIDNFSGDQLSNSISHARQAGAKVVINNERAGSMPPLNPQVAGTEGFQYARTARLEADWAIQDSNGKADVLVIGAAGVPGSDIMLEAMKQEFPALCPACKVTYTNVAVADWATQLPTVTSTQLNRDPSINYIIPIWDGMVFDVAPGVRNAGAAHRVKIVTSNGTPAIMEMLKQRDIVAADISDPMQWLGWAAFDQAMRVLQGKSPIDERIPSRLFDSTNIDQIDIAAGVPAWYRNVYVHGFRRLWGLGS
jgi:ribose transport system substrate-binding protein